MELHIISSILNFGLAGLSFALSSQSEVYKTTDFGVQASSHIMNKYSIQSAINAAGGNGGVEVLIPSLSNYGMPLVF